MKVLKGKPVAEAYQAELKEKIAILAEKNIKIKMGIVVVGDDHGSNMYAKFMKKTCENIGFEAEIYKLDSDVKPDEVAHLIKMLNANESIHGILPMMPMPAHIDERAIIELIDYRKDLDGLTTLNIGLTNSGKDGFWPCTPLACMAILDYYKIPLSGKKVVVLGRSNVVGKPVASLLTKANATVTICHSRTLDIADEIKRADIVIAAIGVPQFVKAEMLKPGAVVIDVGINELKGETVGDVDYTPACEVVEAITPVPGGVGSVTTTMMLQALYKAYTILNK